MSLRGDGLSVGNCWNPLRIKRSPGQHSPRAFFWLLHEMTALFQDLDVRWITEACAGKDVRRTMEDVKRFSAASRRNRSSVFLNGCMVT